VAHLVLQHRLGLVGQDCSAYRAVIGLGGAAHPWSNVERGAGLPATVATVASVAALPEPERWADMMRGLTVDGVRCDLAADALDSLMESGAVERALILGWDVRELIGLHRAKPHDHPARAGLVYSMRLGDRVVDVCAADCAIAIAGTNVRHIWRRVPLEDSICLPWTLKELPYGRP
jgi:hypothetical protein